MKKFLPLLLLSFSTQAEVYQCKNANGQTVFQKGPCAGQINAKPMDLKQPSAALLQKMRIEEKQRDIQYLELKLKERELALREQQVINQAARIDSYNRAINNSIRAREEANAHRNAWNEYMNCRDRYGYSNDNSRSRIRNGCTRPTD
jgi:Skp family chaperone for outer membrane proteins